MKAAGIDPRMADSIGAISERDGPAEKDTNPVTAKALRASRRRRELKAAAEMGVKPPEDSFELRRGSSSTSTVSIRRSRYRREQAALAKLEKEERERERAERALERAKAQAYKRAKQAHLKEQRAREGRLGWRGLFCSSCLPRTGARERGSEHEDEGGEPQASENEPSVQKL